MVKEKKIFKFPDGKGGFYWQRQMPDGKWLPCDEEGNLQEPPVEKPQQPRAEGSAPQEDIEDKSRRRSRSAALRRDTDRVNTCLNFYVTEEMGRRITKYLLWRSNWQGRWVSRSELVAKAVEVFIDRDSNYQAYLKKKEED